MEKNNLAKDIEKIRESINNSGNNIERELGRILAKNWMKPFLKFYDDSATRMSSCEKPTTKNVTDLVDWIGDDIEEIGPEKCSNEIMEIAQLISDPHFSALLCAHDTIADQRFLPELPDIPHEVDEDDSRAIKIVRLIKNNGPLGATIKVDEGSGTVYVARVMHGGVADRSGLIHIGDEVLEINGVRLEGKPPEEIVNILTSITGSICMKLVPSKKAGIGSSVESKLIIRACFNYMPEHDERIPCKEAGLPFRIGDVLQVVSKDDKNWWQARRIDDNENSRAGLIPSIKCLHSNQSTNGYIEVGQYTLPIGFFRPLILLASSDKEKEIFELILKSSKCKLLQLIEVKGEENDLHYNVDDIKLVTDSGKVSVLIPHLIHLPYLYTSALKPITLHAILGGDRIDRTIEEQCGRFIDYCVRCNSEDEAVEFANTLVGELQGKPQWVPASWLR